MSKLLVLLQALLGAATLFSIFYTAFAAVRVLARWRCVASDDRFSAPVSILKPLCGLDPELYENLCSFCRQDYPDYEVLFGVRDPNDPAVPIAERIVAEFPRIARLVVNPRTIGPNYKVGNLANLSAIARHDIFVLADSDMRVTPGYLRAVVGLFEDPRVGATTCLYRGTPLAGVWSLLGAMGINEWFLPSATVATTFGALRYCFGATIAVRRKALDEIGGFDALAQELADDYLLGRRVSDQGLKVRLAPYLVEDILYEPSLQTLFLHELRWARTIRASQPLGYAFSFLTYPVLLACLSVVALPAPLGPVLGAAAVACRVLLHAAVRIAVAPLCSRSLWLVPVRDVLGVLVWCASFFGSSVRWRSEEFVLDPTGRITALPGQDESRAPVPKCQPD